jgi:hypothetical protein
VNRRYAKKVARWWAGAIVDAVINDGFRPEILRQEYTAEERRVIQQELTLLAQRLMDTGEVI